VFQTELEQNSGMRHLRDFDILTLCGWRNAGPDHWQTYWESAFPNMHRVEHDDWEAPVYSDWSRRLTQTVSRCERSVLIVAHSLGTALAVRWSHDADTRAVAGAFLVAPSDLDQLGPLGYPARGFDPVVMKPLPFPSFVLASRNDERVTFERAEAFAAAWGSRLIDVGAVGHIGSAAKLGIWPQGLVWFGQFIESLSQNPRGAERT
jgi:predicted alpha/beta hydrolase family esterase